MASTAREDALTNARRRLPEGRVRSIKRRLNSFLEGCPRQRQGPSILLTANGTAHSSQVSAKGRQPLQVCPCRTTVR